MDFKQGKQNGKTVQTGILHDNGMIDRRLGIRADGGEGKHLALGPFALYFSGMLKHEKIEGLLIERYQHRKLFAVLLERLIPTGEAGDCLFFGYVAGVPVEFGGTDFNH